MDITLRLAPFMSEQYSLERHFLKIPVMFTYEDKFGSFSQNITDGLPIIGKPHPESKVMSYFIGDSCSVDQLSSFISSIGRGIPCNITFSENDDVINAIEYDPASETWKHKTGSKMGNYGSTLTMKLSQSTVRQFKSALENYRKLAFMTIEGHRRLAEETPDDDI